VKLIDMCVTRAVRVQNLQNQHQTRKSRVVHWFIASSSIKTIRGDTLVRELHRYDIFYSTTSSEVNYIVSTGI